MTISKSGNKVISLLLAIALVLTMFVTVAPTNVMATGTSIGISTPNGIIIEEGTCGKQGDNLTWTYTNYGVLTISGTGEMADYSISNEAPWGGITDVIIEDGVTSIGDYAFYEHYSLTSVTIPNTITTIGEYAFYDCTHISSLTIPSSVTTIGEYAFYDCRGLTAITVDEANPNYISVDGVLFNKNKTEILLYPASDIDTDYTIPNTVTTIGTAAFAFCKNLTSITIPNSVTTIGKSAFTHTTLESITIPNSVTTIGSGAFSWSYITEITFPSGLTTIADYLFYANHLTSVTIPSNVTEIGENAFGYGEGLTSVTISNGVTTIDNYAFSETVLTSVTIPSSVTTIGENVFCDCPDLTAITVDAANPNYTSVDGVLFNKNKTELIKYPEGKTSTEYTIPNSVTTIDDYAFGFSANLTSVTIPNSVTSIGMFAFSGDALTSVTIPSGVTSIGAATFEHCEDLTTVTIKATVPPAVSLYYDDYYEDFEYIEMFKFCDNLTKIYVPVGTLEAYQTAEYWSEYAELYEEKNLEEEIPTPDPEPDPEPTPDPDPTPEPTPTPDNAYGAELEEVTTAKVVDETKLSAEDKTKLENATTKEVVLTVKAEANPAAAEKAIIDNLIAGSGQVSALFLDIDLDVDLDNGADKVSIKETKEPVTITIIVPENLRVSGRSFMIYRCHNGVATSITPTSYNPVTGELKFKTDRFSLYALAYEDTTPTPTPVPMGGGVSTHVHSYKYNFNKDGHWQNCSCGAGTVEEKHSLNAQGVCECGYNKNGTTQSSSSQTVANPSTGAQNNIIFVVALLSTLAIFATTNIVSRKKHSK